MLEHLLAVERQTGVTPQALLDAPPLPEGCEELWRIFNELHLCRGDGPKRITYADIHAFQTVTGVRLEAWERSAIHEADQAFMDKIAERRPQNGD